MTTTKLTQESMQTIFDNARSYKSFLSKSVDKQILKDIYDTFKFGPTAYNCTPLRIVYVTSEEGRQRLFPTVVPANMSKTESAPVTAILAYDMGYDEFLPRLAPDYMTQLVKNDPSIKERHAPNNAWLQAGYFITAVRAHGLDACPMSGFSAEKVDKEFFDGKQWKSFMIISIGYGDAETLYPRAERLAYEEAVMEV